MASFRTLRKVCGASFKEPLNVVGMVVGGAQLFNLVVQLVHGEILPLLLGMLSLFREASQFISWLLLEWWLELSLPQAIRDFIFLYMILGGITFRAKNVVARLHDQQPHRPNPDLETYRSQTTIGRVAHQIKKQREEIILGKLNDIKSRRTGRESYDKNVNADNRLRSRVVVLKYLKNCLSKIVFCLFFVLSVVFLIVTLLFTALNVIVSFLLWPKYVWKRFRLPILYMGYDPVISRQLPNYDHDNYDFNVRRLRFGTIFIMQFLIVCLITLLFLAINSQPIIRA